MQLCISDVELVLSCSLFSLLFSLCQNMAVMLVHYQLLYFSL